MYSKILVPLDGSRISERILPYARRFSEAFDSSVELLHVVAPEAVETFVKARQGGGSDAVESDFRKKGEEYLAEFARSFPNPSGVQCVVELGRPADVIAERAETVPDVLVAMCTRGHSGLKRWLLGSVAGKVLRGIKTPLLLVKSDEGGEGDGGSSFTRVLVPLDGSELAEKALPHAIAIAKGMNVEVEIVRVYSPPLSAIVPPIYPAEPEVASGQMIMEAAREEAENYLQEKVDQLRGRGLSRVSYAVSGGDAAGGIVETAQRTKGNLIAMSTHGRSGVGRWVLGSVAERVFSETEDPLLLIPAADRT